jgi:mannose-6-phosphate isomerase-like protein (cupin superfamily)
VRAFAIHEPVEVIAIREGHRTDETLAACRGARQIGGMRYAIDTEVKFGPLERVDVGALAAACREPWSNQSLLRVNDCVLRLGVFQGEFHWHQHAREDEVFYVVSGQLLVDLEGRTVELGPEQALLVPHGTRHRTRAPERTVVLMTEAASVVPTGDEPESRP